MLPTRLTLDPRDRRQSPDEQKLLSLLDGLWDEGKRARERWATAKDVERDLKLYRGEVGSGKREPLFEANFIQAFIDRMVSQLTDNRPILRVNHLKEGLRTFSQVSQKVITGEWTTARMQRQLFKLAHTAATTRSAGIYTGYDPVNQEMVIETLKLSQMSVDPAIEEAALMYKAEYVIIDRIRPCADLAARFLGRGAAVKADATISDSPDKAKARGVLSPLSDFLNGKPSSVDALPRAHVWECIVNDRQRDPGGRLMFPGGRHILRTKELVLWDGPNPYWDGVHPIDWYDWIVDPEHPWGSVSEPKRLMRLQLSFNQIMDGLVENKLLTNFITVVMDHDAVMPETLKKLQNIGSSLILRKQNRNAGLAVTPPPVFGADSIALSRAIFTFAQLLAGVTDVTLGESPGSLQSGTAIDGLQEGANLMTRSRASRMEDLIASVGQKLLARTYQFFPSDRVIALTGPTGSAKDYAIKRTEFFVDDDGQALTPEARREVFKYVRLVVSPGSSAPGSRINRAKSMMQLFVAGLIPGIEVLRAADFPEPQELFDQAQQEASKRDPEAQKKLQAMLSQTK